MVELTARQRRFLGSAIASTLPAESDTPTLDLTTAVAVDCEMVQLAGGKLALAQVCAVDYSEAVLLNERVAPSAPVKDYLTRYSGLRPGDLDDSPNFDSVQAKVKTLLDGRVLVGHSVSNDLKYLRLKHPVALTVDTAALDWGGREVGLAKLAREVLGVDIQGATHCPEEDALTSLRLLKYHVAHGGPPPLRTVDVALEFAAAVPRTAVSKLHVGIAAEPAEPPAADDDADASSARWTLRVPWSRASRGSLLKWFKKFGRPAGATALIFPPSLSKQERGAVHRDAQNLKLPTESRGVDDDRHIRVLASAEAAAAAAAAAAPPPRVQQLSEMVYRGGRDELMRAACESGATTPAPALSLGEVAEILAGGGALRPPYDAALRRAEALLRAAEGTVPAYDVGVALGERMQLEWRWACRCAEACGT